MAEETPEPKEQDQPVPQPPQPESLPAEQAEQQPGSPPAEAQAAQAGEKPPAAAAEEDQAEPAETEAPEAEPGEEGEEQEPEFDYGVEVEDAGTLKRKVKVTVPREAIEYNREKMFGELQRSAQVPGFRIGRAPRRLIEKRFGRDVSQDVRNAVVGRSLGKAIEKADLQVLGEPDLKLEEIELPESGDMTYDFEVEVAPQFELPELKGIEVDKPIIEVTDARIDGAIQRMQLREAKYESTNEAAAEQDLVTGTAKITGEGIDAVTTDVSLRVAPGQIEGLPLVDLGRELAGKKAGETVTFTVQVPDVHPNERWQGKEARIELTIGRVRKRVLPEADDEFAKARGYDSLAELRQGLIKRMSEEVALDIRRAMRSQIHDYLLAHTDMEVPVGVATRHAQRLLQRRLVDLMEQGVPEEEIRERLTEVQADIVYQAVRDLKLAFILQRIADEQGVEVTEEDVSGRVGEMARSYGRRPERLRQELASDGSLAQVEVAMREERAIDALLRDAKITEVTPEQYLERRAQRQREAEEARAARAALQPAQAKPAEAQAAAPQEQQTPAEPQPPAGGEAPPPPSDAEPPEATRGGQEHQETQD
jgi:trigger factor